MPARGLIPSEFAQVLSDAPPVNSEGTQTADAAIKNVSLGGGGQTTLVERWLLEEVTPRIAPKKIIWGISSLDFTPERRGTTINRYNAARGSRTGAVAAADRYLASFSALARNRAALRDPYAMLKVITGGDLSTRLPDRAQPQAASFEFRSHKPLTIAQLQKMRLNMIAFARNVQLRGYALGADEIAAFTRTLRRLKASNIEATVVLMPVTQDFIDAHPNGEQDFNKWRDRVSAAAKSEGVTLLDRTRAMPDTAFRDPEHLLVSGARTFSLKVATDLKRQGW